ncbi:MAG: radical SAM protein [Spirochaetes bacterium]|nr:radical SAM protein [Spirochaetota bacterium]
MIIREIRSKSILSVSKIFDYVINPYVGCAHGCLYCYARFMKKFTGHREPWGDFVDIKVNAADLLAKELGKKKRGQVWMSGVCDPYQPLETRYRLTRACLALLADHDWPVTIQTRSPLVLRDIDIIRRASDIEVGFSITTADDAIRKLFEPKAPPIGERIRALGELRRAGIATFAMIAPALPGAVELVGDLEKKVDYVLVDRMNYHHADRIYRTHGLGECNTNEYFFRTGNEIASRCEEAGIDCRLVM